MDSVMFGWYICYDDGCHLQKYAQNTCRSRLTKTAEGIAKLKFVIDRMHMKGHTDAWCRRTCDPKLFPQLANVRDKILQVLCPMCMTVEPTLHNIL